MNPSLPEHRESSVPADLSSTYQSKPGIFNIPQFSPGVTAAFSSRLYTESTAPQFVQSLSLDPSLYYKPKQVHGDDILILEKGNEFSPDVEADGVMTVKPGLVLGIKTADCIPAFYWDPVRKAAGLAHAGWRGLHKGILTKMASLFKSRFYSNMADLQIVFGPAAGVCCYETGPEFADYFPGFFKPKSNGKGMTDLISAARAQLVSEGIRPSNINSMNICTVCRSDEFYSARKGAETERILSVISIRS